MHVKVLCFAPHVDKKPYMCPAQMHQILILVADRKLLLSKRVVTALGISASYTETSENQYFNIKDRLKIEELAQLCRENIPVLRLSSSISTIINFKFLFHVPDGNNKRLMIF